MYSKLREKQMRKVSTSMVQDFWQALQPSAEAERPWLYQGLGPRAKAWSSKDLLAQANCLGAFLVQRGLQPGQHVIIRMEDDPLYLTLDLAVQFAGGINMTLPANATNELLISTANQLDPKFLLIDQSEGLESTEGFESMQNGLDSIILLNENPSNLPPEKLFTYERAIILGKGNWRENTASFNATKASRSPDDIYARTGDELTEVSYKKFILDADEAQKQINEKGGTCAWFIGNPSSYSRRILGYFATMLSRPQTRSVQEAEFSLPISFDPNPESIFMTPEKLEALFSHIAKNILGKNGEISTKFVKAQEISQKRREALSQDKKPSLAVRTKYSLAQSSIFSKGRKAFGTKCKTIFLNEGDFSEEVRNFFEDAALEITQPTLT